MSHDPENCREVFAALSQYLDLELPPAACEDIEAHLAGCAPCVEFLESLRKTVEVCREYQPGAAPGPLTDEARAAIELAWRKALAAREGATDRGIG
jgi:hypothetical protein